MRKIGMWIGGLGVIGTIIFMLKNRFEDMKEIKRLDKKHRFWEDAFATANHNACALAVEKGEIRFILRKMVESGELDEAMVRARLTHTQAEMLDDYIWGD